MSTAHLAVMIIQEMRCTDSRLRAGLCLQQFHHGPIVVGGDHTEQTLIRCGPEPAEAGVDLAVPIGTMIELPRAALTAHRIAEAADFFSFGTNDLTQTTWGFSRDDEERADLLGVASLRYPAAEAAGRRDSVAQADHHVQHAHMCFA